MSIRTYDQQQAQGLIPFFESIAQEISERRTELRLLEVQELQTAPDSAQAAQLQAQKANHRKEIRLALKEITRLGCTIGREHPLRVVIPGPHGQADEFSWSPGQALVEPTSAETAA